MLNELYMRRQKQAQTRAAVQEEKELCSNLQSRLADCECMLQQLRNIESRYQEQTKREAPEQYVEFQDKIILEKKSTQYKEVSSICKAFNSIITGIRTMQVNNTQCVCVCVCVCVCARARACMFIVCVVYCVCTVMYFVYGKHAAAVG